MIASNLAGADLFWGSIVNELLFAMTSSPLMRNCLESIDASVSCDLNGVFPSISLSNPLIRKTLFSVLARAVNLYCTVAKNQSMPNFDLVQNPIDQFIEFLQQPKLRPVTHLYHVDQQLRRIQELSDLNRLLFVSNRSMAQQLADRIIHFIASYEESACGFDLGNMQGRKEDLAPHLEWILLFTGVSFSAALASPLDPSEVRQFYSHLSSLISSNYSHVALSGISRLFEPLIQHQIAHAEIVLN